MDRKDILALWPGNVCRKLEFCTHIWPCGLRIQTNLIEGYEVTDLRLLVESMNVLVPAVIGWLDRE